MASGLLYSMLVQLNNQGVRPMSDHNDSNQKYKHISGNVYQIGLNHPQAGLNAAPPRSSRVIKAETLKGESLNSKPAHLASDASEIIGKRVSRPSTLPAPETRLAAQLASILEPKQKISASTSTPELTVSAMKENFKSLTDLQARLRFAIKDLEDLIKI